MKQLLLLAAASSLIALLSTGAQAQDMFDFENIPVSSVGLSIEATSTTSLIAAEAPSVRTLTLSQSGLTAPAGPGSGFEFADNNNGGVGPTTFGNNLSNFVISNAGDGSALETLTLTFDQAVSSLTFQFVVSPAALGNPLVELNALTNTGVSASSAGVANTTLGRGNNEGFLTLTGLFTSISISLNAGAVFPGDVSATVGDTFIVDSFVVTPSILPPPTVPEPGSLALFAGVALPLVWSLRRRKAQQN